jgi:hypothetical protein
MTVRKLRLVRPDVALIDIDVGVFACHARPPGVQAGSDGALRACLLTVLTKDHGKWWIPHKNATVVKPNPLTSSAVSDAMRAIQISLDQADEDAIDCEIADEALEVACGARMGGQPTLLHTYCFGCPLADLAGSSAE